jgi:PhnB protein
MKPVLVPYLKFMGKANDAMTFYKSVFGGELTVQTYGESGQSDNPEEKDLVMHSELKTENFTFMATDGNSQHQVHIGDNISMSVIGSDQALLTGWFNSLAEGGNITLALEKQFWGDVFGQLTDKFGIEWMFNISSGQPEQ